MHHWRQNQEKDQIKKPHPALKVTLQHFDYCGCTSFGYMLLPCASGRYPDHDPLKAGLLFASEKRSGLKTLGSFHKWGDLAM